MSGQPESRRRRLAIGLGVVFLVAMVMGPGPGLYLVNPNPGNPDAVFTVFVMPIVYVWAVCWFFVQAAIVVAAYLWVWDDRETPHGTD